MNDIIYLLCGSAGEYSDRSDWVVAGYYNLDEAELHKAKAEEHHRMAVKDIDKSFKWDEFKNPYDPFMAKRRHVYYSIDEIKIYKLMSDYKNE